MLLLDLNCSILLLVLYSVSSPLEVNFQGYAPIYVSRELFIGSSSFINVHHKTQLYSRKALSPHILSSICPFPCIFMFKLSLFPFSLLTGINCVRASLYTTNICKIVNPQKPSWLKDRGKLQVNINDHFIICLQISISV